MWHLKGIFDVGIYIYIYGNSMVIKIAVVFLTCMCNNMESVCRLYWKCSQTYMWNVTGIVVQGHIPVKCIVCIPVIQVTL